MRLSAALHKIADLWGFVPPAFRPDTRNARFSLALLYASTAAFDGVSSSDALVGDVSVEMELRLPELPAVPAAALFTIDRESWIAASLRGGVRSVDGVDEGFMEMAIAGAPSVAIDFPGLPQAEPPITIDITQVAFDLEVPAGEDALSGHLRLDGHFLL